MTRLFVLARKCYRGPLRSFVHPAFQLTVHPTCASNCCCKACVVSAVKTVESSTDYNSCTLVRTPRTGEDLRRYLWNTNRPHFIDEKMWSVFTRLVTISENRIFYNSIIKLRNVNIPYYISNWCEGIEEVNNHRGNKLESVLYGRYFNFIKLTLRNDNMRETHTRTHNTSLYPTKLLIQCKEN